MDVARNPKRARPKMSREKVIRQMCGRCDLHINRVEIGDVTIPIEKGRCDPRVFQLLREAFANVRDEHGVIQRDRIDSCFETFSKKYKEALSTQEAQPPPDDIVDIDFPDIDTPLDSTLWFL